MATQKNITPDYPIDPDALKSVWYTTLGNTLSHGNTVAGAFGTTVTTGGTYYGTPTNWTTQSGSALIQGAAAMTVNAGGKIELKGESADIMIDGLSLKATLAALQERLNWMQPNTKLEAEWDELRELGDRYRELEQQCKEKSQMWAKLQAIPKSNQL